MKKERVNRRFDEAPDLPAPSEIRNMTFWLMILQVQVRSGATDFYFEKHPLS